MAHICPVCHEWCMCGGDCTDDESEFDVENCEHYIECVPRGMEHIGNEPNPGEGEE